MKKLVVALAISMGVSGIAAASGNAAAGEEKAVTCGGCHGADGNSMTPTYPKLAGQHEMYLNKQIKDIRDGDRVVGLMAPFVANLTDSDIADIAAYYAEQRLITGKADPALVTLGEDIYRGGIPESGVPACMACHSPTGFGNQTAGFPVLGGQHATYTADQLKKFREGARHTGDLVETARVNDGESRMMRDVAYNLKDFEIEAVASYISGLSK